LYIMLFYANQSFSVLQGIRMLPQQGRGFIWDTPELKEGSHEFTLFVPEAKRIFDVSVATTEIDDWNNSLYPTEWIEWKGVGKRDSSRAIPLLDVTLVAKGDTPICPEYTTQPTFKSVLLFPKREDLRCFIGESNAWSPFVGVVKCEDADIKRDTYCVGHIERDYERADSAFRVSNLKFPDGYCHPLDEEIFKRLENEIEEAAEEATLLASKGESHESAQVIPDRRANHDEFIAIPDSANASVTVPIPDEKLERRRKNAAERRERVMRRAQFLQNMRYHQLIVYKSGERGGLVGYAPMIGSVRIVARHLKEAPHTRVDIGHCLKARVEFDNIRAEFFVDTISEISSYPFTPLYIQQNAEMNRTDLMIHCVNLDLSRFKPIKGLWEGKKVGTVKHDVLVKVLVPEDDAMSEMWKGKTVKALLLHYEGIENSTPGRLRLILQQIEGLAEEEVPLLLAREYADIPIGRPDYVESDDDEEEEDEGMIEEQRSPEDDEVARVNQERAEPAQGYSYGYEEYRAENRPVRRVELVNLNNARRRNRNGPEEKDHGFEEELLPARPINGRGVFGNRAYRQADLGAPPLNWSFPQRQDGQWNMSCCSAQPQTLQYQRDARGNWIRESQPGCSREIWGNQSSNSERRTSQIERNPSPVEKETGLLAFHCIKYSLFYTLSKHLVEYTGNAGVQNLKIGSWARFHMNCSTLPYKIRHETVEIITRFSKQYVRDGEIYLLNRGTLNPTRTEFACAVVSDVKLGNEVRNLKLSTGDLLDITRLKLDHKYDVWVRFNGQSRQWEFSSIEVKTDTYELEQEDEIQVLKREEKQKLQSRISMSDEELNDLPTRISTSDEDFNETRKDWREGHNTERNSIRYSKDKDNIRRHKTTKSSIHSTSGSFAPSVAEGSIRSSSKLKSASNRSCVPTLASTSSRMTTATLTQEKSLKDLQRQLREATRLLQAVWGYQEVRNVVREDNFFMYDHVGNWLKAEEEDQRSRE
ncbi:hypothetical protein PMAYCL1PPCAC_30563, partial [Pristionchus mayeri]